MTELPTLRSRLARIEEALAHRRVTRYPPLRIVAYGSDVPETLPGQVTLAIRIVPNANEAGLAEGPRE